jgi:hypothetical protein
LLHKNVKIHSRLPALQPERLERQTGGLFGANHQLRQPMVFLNIPLLQQPEFYLGNAAELFNGGGEITDQAVKDFLQGFAGAFARCPYMD